METDLNRSVSTETSHASEDEEIDNRGNSKASA